MRVWFWVTEWSCGLPVFPGCIGSLLSARFVCLFVCLSDPDTRLGSSSRSKRATTTAYLSGKQPETLLPWPWCIAHHNKCTLHAVYDKIFKKNFLEETVVCSGNCYSYYHHVYKQGKQVEKEDWNWYLGLQSPLKTHGTIDRYYPLCMVEKFPVMFQSYPEDNFSVQVLCHIMHWLQQMNSDDVQKMDICFGLPWINYQTYQFYNFFNVLNYSTFFEKVTFSDHNI